MRGRDLADPPKQRARWIEGEVEGVVDNLLVPGGRHAGREQSLGLRCEVEDAVDLGVEERLDAKTIPRGEEHPARVIPQNEGELPAKVLEARRTALLVEVDRDLAIGPGPKAVTLGEERLTDGLVAVELAVDDDADPLVLGSKWLVGSGVDEAQAGVPERDPPVAGLPQSSAVRSTMGERVARSLGGPGQEAPAGRKQGDDPAHLVSSSPLLRGLQRHERHLRLASSNAETQERNRRSAPQVEIVRRDPLHDRARLDLSVRRVPTRVLAGIAGEHPRPQLRECVRVHADP